MYKVEITKLDHQGRGIGRINDKIIFVPKALPNEVIDADIMLEKKNFYEGKVKEILKESEKRIDSICPYFNNCGGCQFLNFGYEESLNYKENKVKEIFNKYLSSNIKINDIIASGDNLYYRNKATFQVEDKIGFYGERSNNLIPIDECYIVDKHINNIYKLIKDNVNLNNINQIIIRFTKNTNESMVVFKTAECIEYKGIVDLLKESVTSIYINDQLIYGKDKILEKLFDLQFYISPKSFFQVNTNQAEKLYFKAIEYADITKNDTVLDLYCGTGTIGILVAKYARKVIGIEINKDAIRDAKENMQLNNIKNIEFYAGDVGKNLSREKYKPNIVIVDPPRAGLDKLSINQILSINPEKIVYVSCDLMTLVRDLKILSNNYDISEVTPVDMFPMTSHVECVSVLSRKS